MRRKSPPTRNSTLADAKTGRTTAGLTRSKRANRRVRCDSLADARRDRHAPGISDPGPSRSFDRGTPCRVGRAGGPAEGAAGREKGRTREGTGRRRGGAPPRGGEGGGRDRTGNSGGREVVQGQADREAPALLRRPHPRQR